MNIRIETERIIVRPFTLDDVDAFYELNNDPEVNKYLPEDERGVSKEQVAELIEKGSLADYEKYGYGRLVMVHKASNKAIGFTGLKYLPEYDETDVGYRIAKEYWGQGLVVEATRPIIKHGFEQLNLERIIALAIPENKASRRVMEKLGFTYVKNILYEGEDVVYYEVLKDQYNANEDELI